MIAEVFAAFALVVPAGFREAPALEPAASFVAGKPVQVWCGTTKLADVYESGFAAVGGTQAFLDDEAVCRPLEQTLGGRRATQAKMAMGLGTLTHEGVHLRGVADECIADITALRLMSAVGIRFFGLRGQRGYLHGMMDEATGNHSRKPLPYRNC